MKTDIENKEPKREQVKEQIKEPKREQVKEQIKEPKREQVKEQIKEQIKEPKREQVKEQIKEPKKEQVKEHQSIIKNFIRKEIIITLRHGNKIKGKLETVAQYELVITVAYNPVIVMKHAIDYIELAGEK